MRLGCCPNCRRRCWSAAARACTPTWSREAAFPLRQRAAAAAAAACSPPDSGGRVLTCTQTCATERSLWPQLHVLVAGQRPLSGTLCLRTGNPFPSSSTASGIVVPVSSALFVTNLPSWWCLLSRGLSPQPPRASHHLQPWRVGPCIAPASSRAAPHVLLCRCLAAHPTPSSADRCRVRSTRPRSPPCLLSGAPCSVVPRICSKQLQGFTCHFPDPLGSHGLVLERQVPVEQPCGCLSARACAAGRRGVAHRRVDSVLRGVAPLSSAAIHVTCDTWMHANFWLAITTVRAHEADAAPVSQHIGLDVATGRDHESQLSPPASFLPRTSPQPRSLHCTQVPGESGRLQREDRPRGGDWRCSGPRGCNRPAAHLPP